MIDPYWISLIVLMGGACTRTVYPYLIKCMEEPETKFQMSYLYSLLIPAILGAIGLIPSVITPSPQYYVALFAAGVGIESVVADEITRRKKRKGDK